jgi:hypothetical protein
LRSSGEERQFIRDYPVDTDTRFVLHSEHGVRHKEILNLRE